MGPTVMPLGCTVHGRELHGDGDDGSYYYGSRGSTTLLGMMDTAVITGMGTAFAVVLW